MKYQSTATLHRADTLASAQRKAPKIHHEQMNAAADRAAGPARTYARKVGCGCGLHRLPDKEMPDNRWMARCGCGRVGYGNTLAEARAEMEKR